MDPSPPGFPFPPPDRPTRAAAADGPRVQRGQSRRRRTFLRVTGPADLVAAMPYLVGFEPVRSVVVVSLRGARLRCGLVARVDVPLPGDVNPWAAGLVSFVLQDQPREVVVLVHHDRRWRASRRPFGPAVEALERRFADAGVALKDALYVTPERFWSYLCSDPRCCPPEGRPLAPGRSSAIVASYVAEGKAPLTDRDAVLAQLDPGPADVLAATRAEAERSLKTALACRPDLPTLWRMWQVGTAELFSRLVRRRLDGDTTEPSLGEVGRVAAGLLDRTTRDLVGVRSTGWLRAMPGMDDWLGSPNSPLEAAPDDPGSDLGELQRLLRACGAPEDARVNSPQGQQEVAAVLADLCRRCDGELAVSPLVLAGMQAWSSGEGVLAWAAVDRALELDPDCTMAGLLKQLLEHGIAPAWVDQDRAEDEAAPPRASG